MWPELITSPINQHRQPTLSCKKIVVLANESFEISGGCQAMGMKPKVRKPIAPAKLAKHEMEQLMHGSIHDEEPEAAPPDSADPTKGIGFLPYVF